MSPEYSYTILLPASSAHQVANLLPLVTPIAQAPGAHLILLHVTLTTYGGASQKEGNNGWLAELEQKLRSQGIDVEAHQKQAHSVDGAIREAVAMWEPDLLVLSWSRPIGKFRKDVDVPLRSILVDVPCDMMVWRGHDRPPVPGRILIPTAGGPNATLAIHIADLLSDAYHGQITVLSILPDSASEEDFEQAHKSLREALGEQLEKIDIDADAVHISVVRSKSPRDGILEAAGSGEYDLLMIGASREGIFNRLVFGDVPERVARQAQIPVVVLKRPLPQRITLGRKAWDWMIDQSPTLNEAEKIQVYRDIRRNARAGPDFFTMMALSTAIASLGLLLDSPAVVIGAMLVAPLMSAIVALGLAVVQGDARLLMLSLGTAARGVFLSVVIAFLIGLLVPLDDITAEMSSRASPSLLDLAVALASGAAAAYALSREDVSTSLPGVAIAVALVPPLATVGLALSDGAFQIAIGASLLFATNLVAIAAMGGFVFLLLGFQPEPGRQDRMMLFTRGWGGLIVLLFVIAGLLIWQTLPATREAEIETILETTVHEQFSGSPGVTIRDYDVVFDEDDVVHVTLEVEAAEPVDSQQVQVLQEQLAARLDRSVALTVKTIPTIDLPPIDPPTPTPPPLDASAMPEFRASG